jgi:3-oxoacyl-(acyl-carrier-protein) synthase
LSDVLVTGIGMVTPLGWGSEPTWVRLLAGHTAVGGERVGHTEAAVARTRQGAAAEEGFNGADPAIRFVLTAATEAIAQSGLGQEALGGGRAAVVIGCSKGCVLNLLTAHKAFLAGDRSAAAELVSADPAEPARAVGRRFAVTGPCIGMATACATGLHAVIRGAQLIADGLADVVLAGATDASIHPLFVSAFRRMGVLAEANGDATTACRPFDRRRRGFALGEGAGVLVLESPQSVSSRGGRPLGRLLGWGTGADPTGLAELANDGEAVAAVVRRTLAAAGVGPKRIGYVNAHGTATQANDPIETRVLKAALGPTAPRTPVSSVKGALGHMMGAAGAVEAAITVLSVSRQVVPPTVNLTEPDPGCDLDYVPRYARPETIEYALKLSTGFGGAIGALVVGRAGSPP